MTNDYRRGLITGMAMHNPLVISSGASEVGVVNIKFTVQGQPYENLEVLLKSENDTLKRFTNAAGIAKFYVEPGEYAMSSLYGSSEENIVVSIGAEINLTYDNFSANAYGDGSLNAVAGGYNGKLVDYEGNVITSTNTAYSGNLALDWNGGTPYVSLTKGFEDANCDLVTMADHTYANNGYMPSVAVIKNSETGNIPANKYVIYVVNHGVNGSNVRLSDIYITKDGINYTLKSAVETEIIQPMVVISSVSHNVAYIYGKAEIFNLYTGGIATGNYPMCAIAFVTKQTIDSFTVTNLNTRGSSFQFGDYYAKYCSPVYGVTYKEE